MATREELEQAYSAFRIPIGSDWRAIKKRYKLLVKAWHPDKQGSQDKEDVQQELKEYNHFYNDVFKKHFESEHSEDMNCLCQPIQKQDNEVGQDHSSQENSFSERTEEEFFDPETEARSQRRRWQASVLCGIVFVAILAYGFLGNGLKSMMPVAKLEPINSSLNSSTLNKNPNWRAPYQSISTPITQSQRVSAPAPNNRSLDDLRRNIETKESKMQLLQQSIDSLKAQIKMARPDSAGMLYRDLGQKESELRMLQQDVYYLKIQLIK